MHSKNADRTPRDKAAWKGIEHMARVKSRRRSSLARLSFEEKVSILIRLQEAANFMYKASGRKALPVWKKD